MYRHIEKVQKLCPVKIEIIKMDFDYWFGEHIKTRGKRKGEKGYGFPDPKNRWCTAFKRDIIRKLQTNKDLVIQYHGITLDEKHRIEKNNKKRARNILYPLVNWRITGEKALKYCYNKGFTWEGLYEKFHRTSCWCCPFSSIEELRVLYNDFPELWGDLIEMDKKSFRKFRNDYSVDDLNEKFAGENKNHHKPG